MKNGSNVIIYKYIVVQKWLYVAGGSITSTLCIEDASDVVGDYFDQVLWTGYRRLDPSSSR
jgi:hypothetical protein